MLIRFFALKEDLLPVLEFVDSKGPFKYIRTGAYALGELTDDIIYYKGTDLPDLGKASADSGVCCDQFLVCERKAMIYLRFFETIEGERVFIDGRVNPDTVTLRPGGLWNDEMVIEGTVGTGHNSEKCRALMKLFLSGLRKTFTCVRGAYVGPKAMELLKAGKRLTQAAQCPREFDLTLDEGKEEPSLNAAKLYELAKELAPGDPSLVEQLRLAVEQPSEYFTRFRKRLAQHGIKEWVPESGAMRKLAWIALVEGLAERDLLLNLYWSEHAGTVVEELNQFLGDNAVDWEAVWPEGEDEYTLHCEEVLELAGKYLRKNGLALVVIDTDSDYYPVLAVPLKRLKRIQRLARESGYGMIIRAEELLE